MSGDDSDEDSDGDKIGKIIQCYCEDHCPSKEETGICVTKPGGMCFAVVEALEDDYGNDEPVRSYGCLPPNEMALLQCKADVVPHAESKSIKCCDESDFCNKNLFPMYTVDDQPPDTLQFLLLGSSICFGLVIIFMLAIGIWLAYRRREINRYTSDGEVDSETSDLKINNNPNLNKSKSGKIETDFVEQSNTSGSGSLFMVQTTISKQLEMKNSVGRGRYGEVLLATWRGEKVAVKVFASTQEASWFRETEIYQTTLLRHNNILGYIGADIAGTGGCTQMLLITEYHHDGSLYDYLQDHSLNTNSLLIMSKSIARGLSFLHTEIFGVQGKPSIAHRDIKSKNILVKSNGECCIADFGMAVKYNRKSNKVDVSPTDRGGTKRYMAPEILDKSIDLENFDAHVMTDIYSFGLVLWEMTWRCAIGYLPAKDYAPPFHDCISNDPSFDEMQEVVCVKRIRPTIPEIWNTVDVLKIIASIMQEMWHHNPAVRLTGLRVQKNLNKLETISDVSIKIMDVS